jgi:hypothetical protein
MVAAFPADHPMASVAGPMSMDMLRDQPFILYRQADGPACRTDCWQRAGQPGLNERD